jgi:hypothetical protein
VRISRQTSALSIDGCLIAKGRLFISSLDIRICWVVLERLIELPNVSRIDFRPKV